MQVFVALLLISSVVARGSGPYLPSGWKPDGPAFNLPSEVAQSVLKTAQEPLVEETEASGSDALREYGPPKLEVFVNANQRLPDVATDRNPFQALKSEEVVADVQEAIDIEGNAEQVAAIIEETSIATESNGAEAVKPVEDEVAPLSDVQTSAGSPATDAVDQEEVSRDITQIKEANELQQDNTPAVIREDSVISTAVAEEIVVPLYQQELQQDAVPTLGLDAVGDQESVPEAILTPSTEVLASIIQHEQELTQDSISTPIEEVKNIAEAVVSLEEVKAVEIQANEGASDITPSQAVSGTPEQAPEGLLEYSPPGFLEYGPPQEGLHVLAAEVTSSASASDSNEVRRRRFSPKFRSLKIH